MSDEVTLREHLDAILAEREKRYTDRFNAQEKAIEIAHQAQQQHFESINNLQHRLDEQSRTMISRNEYYEAHSAIVKRQDESDKRLLPLLGAIGLLAAGVPIVLHFIK